MSYDEAEPKSTGDLRLFIPDWAQGSGISRLPHELKGDAPIADPHIRPDERLLLIELRRRILYGRRVASDIEAFVEQHGQFLKDWHTDIQVLTTEERLKTLIDKYTQDFRLVRFLRARQHKLAEAEAMFREALLWRLVLGADSLLDDSQLITPPEWLVQYAGSKKSPTMLRPVEGCQTRLKEFYTRDRENHLSLFLRAGRVKSRKMFHKMCSKSCYIMKIIMWTCELLRYDLEQHRLQDMRKTETLISIIIDLDQFAISEQLSITDFVPIVARFAPIFSVIYPEILHRVLVFNVPRLFTWLWNAVQTFIPLEVKEKLQLHSGKIDFPVHIGRFFDAEAIPQYFGGTMVDENGSEFCLGTIPCYGPYGLPNEGQHLLDDTDAQAREW